MRRDRIGQRMMGSDSFMLIIRFLRTPQHCHLGSIKVITSILMKSLTLRLCLKTLPGVDRLHRPLAASASIDDAPRHRLLRPPCQRTIRSVLARGRVLRQSLRKEDKRETSATTVSVLD